MSILKKRSILKLAATFILVAMMAGAFTMDSSTAKAAACDPATFAQGACDMTVNASFNGDIAFANDADVHLTGAVASGANPFTFVSYVQDQRTIGTDGWTLEATSTGIAFSGGTSIDLYIGGNHGPTRTCTLADASTCPTVTGLTNSTVLTGAALPFLSAAAGTAAPHGGIVTVTTGGTFTLPPSVPPGLYTGTIAITLLNAASTIA